MTVRVLTVAAARASSGPWTSWSCPSRPTSSPKSVTSSTSTTPATPTRRRRGRAPHPSLRRTRARSSAERARQQQPPTATVATSRPRPSAGVDAALGDDRRREPPDEHDGGRGEQRRRRAQPGARRRTAGRARRRVRRPSSRAGVSPSGLPTGGTSSTTQPASEPHEGAVDRPAQHRRRDDPDEHEVGHPLRRHAEARQQRRRRASAATRTYAVRTQSQQRRPHRAGRLSRALPAARRRPALRRVRADGTRTATTSIASGSTAGRTVALRVSCPRSGSTAVTVPTTMPAAYGRLVDAAEGAHDVADDGGARLRRRTRRSEPRGRDSRVAAEPAATRCRACRRGRRAPPTTEPALPSTWTSLVHGDTATTRPTSPSAATTVESARTPSRSPTSRVTLRPPSGLRSVATTRAGDERAAGRRVAGAEQLAEAPELVEALLLLGDRRRAAGRSRPRGRRSRRAAPRRGPAGPGPSTSAAGAAHRLGHRPSRRGRRRAARG